MRFGVVLKWFGVVWGGLGCFHGTSGEELDSESVPHSVQKTQTARMKLYPQKNQPAAAGSMVFSAHKKRQ